MTKISEEDLKELRRQMFRANDKAAIIIDKKDSREHTLKELHEATMKLHTNVIARNKKIDDVDIEEFTDFYVIKYHLSPFEYVLHNKPFENN